MPGCLALLFILAVPVLDVWLLVRIGAQLGGWNTAGLVLVSMMAGLALARRQRERALAALPAQLAAGRLPGAAMADGPLLMLAALLFLTPGFITDALGLLLLVPPLRRLVLALFMRRMLAAARDGRAHVRIFGATMGVPRGPGAPGGADGLDAADGGGGTTGGDGASFEPAREIKELPPGSVRVHRPDAPRPDAP